MNLTDKSRKEMVVNVNECLPPRWSQGATTRDGVNPSRTVQKDRKIK